VTTVSLHPLSGIDEIRPGTDLAAVIAAALRAKGLEPVSGDVIVVAQKIVSKAEGRFRRLSDVVVSDRAREFAAITGKDPRVVELVLAESCEVLRAVRDVLIVRHRLGLVMAQAGIDHSNLPDVDTVLLLPNDPDASAAVLRRRLADSFGQDTGPGVIVSDSFGRPWRLGTTNVAIGAAGLAALWDRRGERDRHGRTLEVTQVAWADAIAGAAGLLMGEGAEGVPVVMVRGLRRVAGKCPARDLVRPAAQDLFR
jgi:coenzyme F420-0:L-glutamate ligase/coenzyme F420-1:gamma-L-glutamate ligase